jgi:hypothetical protein
MSFQSGAQHMPAIRSLVAARSSCVGALLAVARRVIEPAVIGNGLISAYGNFCNGPWRVNPFECADPIAGSCFVRSRRKGRCLMV